MDHDDIPDHEHAGERSALPAPLRPAEEPPELAAPEPGFAPVPAAGGPRQLRPAEAFNAKPGRRGPARDAAQRHGGEPAPLFDFATGKLLPAPFPRRGPGKAHDPHDPPVEPGSRLPPGRGGAFPGGNPSDAPRPKRPKPVARPADPPDAADLLRVIHPVAPPEPPSPAAPGRAVPPPAMRDLRASPPQPAAPPVRRARRPSSRPTAPGRPAPGGPRRLGLPVPVRVTTGQGGRPRMIDGDAVEAVRESWLIEDRWWTAEPLRRRYWEVVTAAGRNLVVFRDLERGTWAMQR